MKQSVDSPAKKQPEEQETEKSVEKKSFSRTALYAGIFYLLMMALYVYFMLANLSSSPKFVYTQF